MQPDEINEDPRVDIPGILDGFARDHMIDRDKVYEVYNEFVENVTKSLEKMQNKLEASKFPEMDAHILKGASACLRLSRLSQHAAELEKQCRSRDIKLCRENMANLNEYCKTNIKKTILLR